MPPRQKVTKEMILEKSFKIVRKSGIDAVTARSVAKEVGCSIQPIFSQFATMEELRFGTFEYISEHLMADIMTFKDAPDFLPRCSMWVIRLARKEPHLFHLLYLSNNYTSSNLLEVMMTYESNHKILDTLMEVYGLDREACKDVLIKGFLFLHGIATMISTNHMDFTDEEVASMMKETVIDIVRGKKERKKE